jgi:hypothetical protein
VEDLLRSPRELLPAKPSEAPPRMGRPRRGAEAGRPPQPEDFERPAKERPSLRSGLGRTARSLIIAAIVAAVAIGGFFAYREWPNIAGLVPQGSTTQVTQKTPPTSSKITDRIGAQSQPDTSAAPQSPTPTTQVAQRVVLYEQQPNSQQRKQYLGSVTWRTEMMSPGPGLPPDLAIKADVEIPERQMRVSLTLQRNTDKTLPASHTIEILFSTPPDFPPGGVTDVPGVLMEEAQTSNGAPLAGMRVKVSEGYFLIGLSPLESEARRNVLLLKQRPWLQIPIIYKNNQRALLAIEKGVPGDRVFADAFAAWKQ